MKVVLFLVCGLAIANIYYDGEIVKKLKSFTKYYKMAGVAFAGLSIYLAMRRGSGERREIVKSITDMMAILPIDTETTNLFLGNDVNARVANSGKTSSRRSVSETKKKYVAASQDWKCGKCQRSLNAWFEVDHITSLHEGGNNHVDNLVALCRECHGEKTALQKLDLED